MVSHGFIANKGESSIPGARSLQSLTPVNSYQLQIAGTSQPHCIFGTYPGACSVTCPRSARRAEKQIDARAAEVSQSLQQLEACGPRLSLSQCPFGEAVLFKLLFSCVHVNLETYLLVSGDAWSC